MPINPGLILGVKEPQQPKPMSAILAEQDAVAAARAKRDAVIQQAKDQQALRRAFQEGVDQKSGAPDFDKILGLGATYGASPDALTKLQASIDEHRKKAADAQKLEYDNDNTHAEMTAKALQAVTDERSYQIALSVMPELKERLGETYDPAKVKQAIAAATSVKDYNDQHKQAIDLLLSGKAEEYLGRILPIAKSQAEWDDALNGVRFMIPNADVILSKYPKVFSPDAAKQAGEMALTEEKRRELASKAANTATDDQRQQDALDEAKRHNRAMEARPVAGGAAAAQGVKLEPDSIDYIATQYRLLGTQGIPTRLSDVEKIPILNAAAKQVKALGQSPVQAVQKQAAFKADAASLTQMTKMKSAAEAFETKANAQADLVLDLSNKVSRTSIPMINAALLSGKRNITGDQDTQLLFNALTTFTSEYAKIMEGSTGSVAASSDAARRVAADLVPAKLTKGALAATIKQMQWEMRQSILGYDVTIQHITDRMGGGSTAQNPSAAATPPPATGAVEVWEIDPKTGKYRKKGGE